MIYLHLAKEWAGHKGHSAADCERGDRLILRLIDELEAAREVVRTARDETTPDAYDDLAVALRAYDQALKGPATSADTSSTGQEAPAATPQQEA